MRPASFSAIGDQPSFLQDAEMEGEPRLSSVEIILQIADTLLAAAKLLDDTKTRLVGECMEELRRPAHVDRSRHAVMYQDLLFGQEA